MDIRLVLVMSRIREEQERRPVNIEETSLPPEEMQQHLRDLRLTEPVLASVGKYNVSVAWDDDDVELYTLSTYDVLLLQAMARVQSYGPMGFEHGQWPGGLRWDQHLGWKRAIWGGMREGSYIAYNERRRQAGPRSPSVDPPAEQ